MKLLTTFYSRESLAGDENYYANIILDPEISLNGKPSVFWFGDMDNDVDGTPYWQNDEFGAPGTWLTYNGKPLNGDKVPFIVVPPPVIKLVPDIVMGCAGYVEYRSLRQAVVVGDVGPTRKIGEGSPAALRALGLPALHNGNGGLDTQEILYRIWPGVPARLDVDGEIIAFSLTPYR